jgi:superfamily II DNA helicase RecQ
MMPYRDVQCSMFNTLISKNRVHPIQLVPHVIDEEALAQRIIQSMSHVIDEDALAQRIVKLIAPSLNDIITKAIESALHKVSNLPAQEEDLDAPDMALYDDPLPLAISVQSDTVSEPNIAILRESPARKPSDQITRALNHTPNGLSADMTSVNTCSTNTATLNELPANGPSDQITKVLNHAPDDPSINTASPIINDPIASMMPRALDKIRSLVGDSKATWTCDAQRDGMEAVLRLKTDVMVLMCTGSGKTMLAIVPSLLEDAVTVVVLPLKSLMMDYRRKLDNMGVLFEEFTGETTTLSGSKNLVLVSADRAKSPQWYQALAELNERVPVHRTICDEAQLAFTSNDFRSALREMHELRQFPMQLIVLSGSIPERSVPTVIEMFGLGQNTVIFRTLTVRPEHRYILEAPRSNNRLITGRVKEIIDSHKSKLTSEDRVLLFVPYLDQGKHIAEMLNCEFYNGSSTLSDPERLKIHSRWMDGTHQFMVCTSAFGAGNDYSHVRMVIHAGTPQEMIGTIQEMGRGGRDHRLTYCYILPRNGKEPPTIPAGMIDHKGALAMHQWVHPKSPTCLRFGLTAFCDPIGTRCSAEPTYQKCSVCLPSKRMQHIQMALNSAPTAIGKPGVPTSTINVSSRKHPTNPSVMPNVVKRLATSAFNEAFESSKRRKVERQVKSHEYIDNMLLILEYFNGICAYCKLRGKDVEKHPIICCPFIDCGDGKGEECFVLWRDKIKYHGFHDTICYRCHVPQTDNRLHRTFEKGGGGCDHPDIVAPVAYAIFLDNHMREAAERYFDQKWTGLDRFSKWMNGKPPQDHKSNLTALLWWYYFVYHLPSQLLLA